MSLCLSLGVYLAPTKEGGIGGHNLLYKSLRYKN